MVTFAGEEIEELLANVRGGRKRHRERKTPPKDREAKLRLGAVLGFDEDLWLIFGGRNRWASLLQR